jgi:hypothetical protein
MRNLDRAIVGDCLFPRFDDILQLFAKLDRVHPDHAGVLSHSCTQGLHDARRRVKVHRPVTSMRSDRSTLRAKYSLSSRVPLLVTSHALGQNSCSQARDLANYASVVHDMLCGDGDEIFNVFLTAGRQMSRPGDEQTQICN